MLNGQLDQEVFFFPHSTRNRFIINTRFLLEIFECESEKQVCGTFWKVFKRSRVTQCYWKMNAFLLSTTVWVCLHRRWSKRNRLWWSL